LSFDLSILIVSHRHGPEVRKCIASLDSGLENLSSEIIVVDNIAEPDFLDQIGGARDRLKLISNDAPLGFGGNLNKAANAATGRVLLILNPDTAYHSGQVADAVQFLEADENRGVVAARLVYPDGSIQRNFRGFPSVGVTFLRALGANKWGNAPEFYRRAMLSTLEPEEPTLVDWVYGSFMLIRKAHFDALGGFDEAYVMYYEDVDLCFRMRKQNLTTWIFPALAFYHEHKRDSAKLIPSRLQRHHVTSLFRYAIKCGALLTPPRFGDRKTATGRQDPTLLTTQIREIDNARPLAQWCLVIAQIASIIAAGFVSATLVSMVSGIDTGDETVAISTLGYGLIFLLFQFMLGEYQAGSLGDTNRRVVAVIETAVVSLFPYLIATNLFVREQQPSYVPYSATFIMFAVAFLVGVTVLVTRRLTTGGAKIALIIDQSLGQGQHVTALPIGQQSVVCQFLLEDNKTTLLVKEISERIRDNRIDHIYFVTSQKHDADIMRFVRRLTMFDVPIWYALNDCAAETRHEVLRLRSPLRSRTREAMKRGLDIAVCFLALVCLSIPMLISALLIYLEDSGPVFFGQPRAGRNGVPFVMLKFRSMYVSESDVAADQLTTKDDARITKVGAFIRRTSIDELPQILNVLRGEMSIVGPRPLPVGFHFKGYVFDDEIPYWNWRNRVAPGITGLSQLNGLRGTPESLQDAREMMRNRAEFDNLYIDNWSIWQDLKIIVMTGVSGAFASKAY
jgi:lipopolysaccharide/colanic/teichoic acid biosynthesis glycosyltransferase/GT2 family glycosyltransferase